MKVTEKWLLDNGFEKIETAIILPAYHKSIAWYENQYKVIGVTIQPGNQYIYLREGDKNGQRELDDVITIYNGDIHGEITTEVIEGFYNALTWKELLK